MPVSQEFIDKQIERAADYLSCASGSYVLHNTKGEVQKEAYKQLIAIAYAVEAIYKLHSMKEPHGDAREDMRRIDKELEKEVIPLLVKLREK